MHETELERRILELVNRPGYEPVKARVIAQRLQLADVDAAEVKQAVKRLVQQGRLVYGSGRSVRAPGFSKPTGNRLVGVFHRTAKGYGFVRPADTAPAPGEDRRSQDVYIPAHWTSDASTGDLVLVQLKRTHGGAPGPRGQIIEVVERETYRFVGTYFEAAGAGYVQVDGTLFTQPIFVGDAGAKDVQTDDKVVIEMVRFPSPTHDGEGVITEVLGPRGRPGVDTLSIIREFNLAEGFPEDALEEAREQAEQFDESIPPGRRDLAHLTVVTIDPADARDFDDAISLEREENGHWVLWVHIADVGHFVRPRSALDREARQRATSVYLPDRVLPMLPEAISNSLASLQPRKVRYAKSVRMEFTPEGICVDREICAAAIRSNRRLSYEQVDAFLADPEPWRRKWGRNVCRLLSDMHQLAMILRGRRLDHGALELTMPEVKIDLDSQGRVCGAHAVEHTESHQIIEEFMLAANQAVAQTIYEKEIPFLRRIHQAPDPRKLKALTEFVRELGLEAESLQSRFELQKLLGRVRGLPTEHTVNLAVLRAMQRAVYSPEPLEHYALAMDCYCHFTSPIRRYPDLTVHRVVDALLAGRKPRAGYDELMLLGQHCSAQEERAEAAERELTRLKLLHYLSQRIGEEMDVVVTGVESFGLFVQGVELPAEGLIHVESLADDYYRFDRTAHTLIGARANNRYRLGDLLRVAVARVDLERRELDFRLVRRRGRAETVGRRDGRGARKTPAGSKAGGAAGTRSSRSKAAAKEGKRTAGAGHAGGGKRARSAASKQSGKRTGGRRLRRKR